MDDNKYLIQAAYRTLNALDLFTTGNGQIGVAEIQKELGTNSNMAFRILYTLEKARYIVQIPETGKYRLSLRTIGMGRAAAASLPITKIARPYLELLSNNYNRRINVVLFVYEQGNLVVVDKISSQMPPKVYAHIGRTMPIHVCAAGKMLASSLPEEELNSVLQPNTLEKFTQYSITNINELKSELRTIARTHLAWEKGEHVQGLNGVACPIFNASGEMAASVCINAFEQNVTLSELETMIDSLQDTAHKISDTLSYIT